MMHRKFKSNASSALRRGAGRRLLLRTAVLSTLVAVLPLSAAFEASMVHFLRLGVSASHSSKGKGVRAQALWFAERRETRELRGESALPEAFYVGWRDRHRQECSRLKDTSFVVETDDVHDVQPSGDKLLRLDRDGGSFNSSFWVLLASPGGDSEEAIVSPKRGWSVTVPVVANSSTANSIVSHRVYEYEEATLKQGQDLLAIATVESELSSPLPWLSSGSLVCWRSIMEPSSSGRRDRLGMTRQGRRPVQGEYSQSILEQRRKCVIAAFRH